MNDAKSPVTVSVILPSYNYGRYLRQRIETILDQSFRDLELIIIDDASTDNSVEVISEFLSDPRVKPVFCKTNSGSVYRRWNEAAAMARGRYLWFAGADDYCELTLLEELVARMEMKPFTGIAFTQSWMIDGDGSKLFRAPAWTRSGTREGKQARRLLLLDTTIANASAVLLDAEIFRELGGFDLRFPLAADWKLYIDFLDRSDLAYIAVPMNYCRIHPATVSLRARRSGTEALERYRLIHELCREDCDLAHLRQAALDREAERSLVNAANQLRRGRVGAAALILSAGAKLDRRHSRRILRKLPYLGKAVYKKVVASGMASIAGNRERNSLNG